jgi:hypothetical protein
MNPKFVAGSGAGAGGDTLSLNHFDGADGSTTMTDEVPGISWAAYNGGELDTAQPKFGSASLRGGNVPDGAVGTFGARTWSLDGSWTLEYWFRIDTLANGSIFGGMLDSGETEAVRLSVNFNSDGTGFQAGSGVAAVDMLDTTTPISADTHYHVGVVKDGSTWSLYFNGNRLATTTNSDPIESGLTGAVSIRYHQNDDAAGDIWIDESRFSKVARYSGATYTVPVAAFTVD